MLSIAGSLSAVKETPTSAVAGLGLILGFGVAEASGSRGLGGVVLLLAGFWCVRIWLRRDGARTAVRLTAVAFLAFVASHLLGLAIGAWPAVLVTAVFVGAICWRVSDAKFAFL